MIEDIINYLTKTTIFFFFDIHYILNLFVKKEENIKEKKENMTFLEELNDLILDEY